MCSLWVRAQCQCTRFWRFYAVRILNVPSFRLPLCLLLVVVVVVSVLYADMLFNRSRCYRHSQIRADTLNMIVCWRWCYSRRRQSALAWAWLGLAWIAFVWFGLGNFAPHGTDFCRMNANHLHTHTRVYTGHWHTHTDTLPHNNKSVNAYLFASRSQNALV